MGRPSRVVETAPSGEFNRAVDGSVVERSRVSRPVADRIARRLLHVERVDPGALTPMGGSLAISAARCLITYVLVPVLAPVIGLTDVLTHPLSILLLSVAAVMSVISLRRVWMADHRLRWPYSAFVAVVLVSLAVAISFDVRALLG